MLHDVVEYLSVVAKLHDDEDVLRGFDDLSKIRVEGKRWMDKAAVCYVRTS